MSHFTALVIGDDVDAQLAPYDENLETAPRREYLDGEDTARIAEHYNLDATELPALAEKMEDWKGCAGGVDRIRSEASASAHQVNQVDARPTDSDRAAGWRE